MNNFFAENHPDQAMRLTRKSCELLKVLPGRVQAEWSEFAAKAQLVEHGSDICWWAEGFEMQVVVMFTKTPCTACDCVGGMVQKPLYMVMNDNGDRVRYYLGFAEAFKGIAECEKEYHSLLEEEGIGFDR